jgi:hypothetical protein
MAGQAVLLMKGTAFFLTYHMNPDKLVFVAPRDLGAI